VFWGRHPGDLAYAAIRPRFGAGPRTALIASVFVWLLVSAWANLTSLALGLFPARLIAITMAWQALEIPLATLAGAWAYREAAETRATAQQLA
jgi:hypothetical protein